MIHELFIFLKTISLKLRLMDFKDFVYLLSECDFEQRIYAIWLRYYFK